MTDRPTLVIVEHRRALREVCISARLPDTWRGGWRLAAHLVRGPVMFRTGVLLYVGVIYLIARLIAEGIAVLYAWGRG